MLGINVDRIPEGTTVLGLDIGGTKLNAGVAIFEAGELRIQQTATVNLRAVSDTEDLLRQAEKQLDFTLIAFDHICAAPAGMWDPATGIVYHADEYFDKKLHLRRALLALSVDIEQVSVVNDFVAQAEAALGVPGKNAEVILAGKPGKGPVRVLGPGTGLGEACWIPDGRNGWVLVRSEGGNVPAPVTVEWQAEFVAWLSRRLCAPVRVEDILCGDGLVKIAEYIVDAYMKDAAGTTRLFGIRRGDLEDLAETLKLIGPGWTPQQIAELVTKGEAELVQIIFGGFLGQEVRSMCLKFWGETGDAGEVVLTGGVIQRCPELCTNRYFEMGFRAPRLLATGDKPQGWSSAPVYHDGVCGEIPVRRMIDPSAGTYGACVRAFRTLAA